MNSSLHIICTFLIGIFCFFSNYSCKPATTTPKDDPQFDSTIVLSLDGKELHPLNESESTIQRKETQLAAAFQNYLEDSFDLENIIWYGRRLAYLYRYHDAIKVYTLGLDTHPNSPELYRHRGHRYISIRNFDAAIRDFEEAARLIEGKDIQTEPDGVPNKLNIPLSNLHFNIWYHWALAYYLKGDFKQAKTLYNTCMIYSTNADLKVATADWLYMTMRRLGLVDEALAVLDSISPDMVIIENDSYFKRLMMYQGLFKPTELLDLDNEEENAQLDIVTQGYGVGNWYYYHGDIEKARGIFKTIISCDYWPAFGYIAAEADLAREL